MARSLNKAKKTKKEGRNSMAENIVFQILRSHLMEGELTPGAPIAIRVDQTLGHDLTGIMAGQTFLAVGADRVQTEASVFYCDHNTLCVSGENADDHLFLKTAAARFGVYFSKPGNGICHFLHCQRFARPGKVMLGADSHTPTSGALGMLAIGSGGLTVAEAALGQGFRMNVPKVMGVKLAGRLHPGVTAKDIALELLRQVSVKGGIGYIVEYCGDGVKELSISERQTIANMSIEIGATTGIFPSDERTREFLKAQRRESDYVPLQPEEGATYDKVVEIDLDRLEPLVAEPSMPDKVCTARKAEGVKPGSVFIGSCTNASYSDIARAACILKGHKVHKDIDCTVAPGSRQVLAQLIKDGVLADLVESGCRILECACGPCIGVGQVPPHNGISVRTSNRNFPGRCGSNDAYVYLASPETAAATAVTGHITDPRDLMDVSVLAKIQEPEAYIIDDSSLIAPEETADRHAVEVIKGPNISELPMRGPVRETIDAGIALKLGDNITTDDIIPAGASILKYISNIPEFAKYTFCYTDPDFVDRARRMGHSVIVGGENYGQGSSREHAAMLPMCLGVEAVIAKSYARIHKENLFNYGILPLIFEDPADYEKLQQGDRLVLENVPEGIRAGRLTVTVPERGLTLTAVLEASDYDKNLLLEGGALNHLAKLQKR